MYGMTPLIPVIGMKSFPSSGSPQDGTFNQTQRLVGSRHCFSFGGILLPTTAQTKPQGGEVVDVGEGRTIGKNKVEIGVKTGTQIVYSNYAGTEVEFNGSNHLILKEDDVVGILDSDDIKDLKPLNERVLIKVAEVEEKTAGRLLLTEASKDKPSQTSEQGTNLIGNRNDPLEIGLFKLATIPIRLFKSKGQISM